MAIKLRWFGGGEEPVLSGQPEELPASPILLPFAQSATPIPLTELLWFGSEEGSPFTANFVEESTADLLGSRPRPLDRTIPVRVLEEDWIPAAVVSFGGEDEVWTRLLARAPSGAAYIVYRVPDSGEIVLIQGYPPKYLYMQSIGPLLAMETIEAKLAMESVRPNLYCESLP